jgi:hypothetical protein
MKNKNNSQARKRFTLLLPLLLCCMVAAAQVRISGRVTGAKGEGLTGISVVVKNTAYGSSTDATGNFSFSADLQPGTYPVEFSGIGFKTKTEQLAVATGAEYTLNSQLNEDPLGLDEVVVTGTSQGTTKRQLGNTISTVKGDQLTKGATPNVLAALQGKTPGAQIAL